ncbi:adenosylcobinamide-phosphate synthase CbiB [Pontivivens nitratireducens]|uniref:Cobalamin biosynthesis protein CobD n=1 Tax=Pontivivens nitratireducens TaxID=2758038 RepID=A0A6G7VP37_9RHOB|nr:adenosylcobinamide-phosphate synthase CbiB [Pontibrevibacter nitratireducens]QIK41781.1 cobalamin biosynthesis protein [Pontibrevibacter nitratireducens]
MILTAALILDALVGEPAWLWSRIPHPAVVMGQMVAALERRLNDRSRRGGVLALCLLLLASGGLGWVLSFLPGPLHVVIVAILLAQRSLTTHVRAVAEGLDAGLDQGRHAVSMIVGRNTETLDEAAIARAAIESGAENLSDGVVAPAFWFVLAGLPGLLIYKAVNTADSMIGHRSARYEAFGWAAARLDDVMNLIPARLTGCLIAVASLNRAVWPVMWRDARRHRSPNAGWPESAMAAALGLRLSGPRDYAEGPSNDPWLNPQGRDPDRRDIVAATRLMWRAWGLLTALLALLSLTLWLV